MIYLITGGQRSGKSSHAQELALELSEEPIYLATARSWDDEFRERIDRHIEDRGEQWTTIEEEKQIGGVEVEGRVVVLDCITLWLTNFFTDNEGDPDRSFVEAKDEFDRFVHWDATFIIVTNEIGMGTHPNTSSGRKFTDLQGWMNQYAAEKADQVILMVSGIPVTIKGP